MTPAHFDAECGWVRVTRQDDGNEVVFDRSLMHADGPWVIPIDVAATPSALAQSGIELRVDVEVGGLHRSTLLSPSLVSAGDTAEPLTLMRECAPVTSREVAWGELADDVFLPYDDGLQPTLIFGFQGDTMITPRLAITWPDGPDELCVYLKTLNAAELDGFDAGGDRGSFVLTRTGDQLVSGLLFHRVDPDAARRQIRFLYEVSGSDIRAEGELELVVE